MEVLRSYRRVLQAQRRLFQHDQKALTAAQIETRLKYKASKNETDENKVNELLETAKHVAIYIDKHVVQAITTGAEDQFRTGIALTLLLPYSLFLSIVLLPEVLLM
eukprot:TRINITY_DN4435_c3_g1_i1.p1 TRINITY_DN4435_c3_g1~~TRINITY_DN4435_c3_g1_i1.p1  ORF type:complete len:123 (+),score=23.64 TRINITY_DN4435_c3_g1_i1:53-370(+)